MFDISFFYYVLLIGHVTATSDVLLPKQNPLENTPIGIPMEFPKCAVRRY